MDWKRTTRRVLIIVAILLVFGILSFQNGFFDTASAPFENVADADPTGGEADASSEVSFTIDLAYPAATIEDTRAFPANQDCVIVRMAPADIFRGDLLLVNQDHRFELPDAQSFISIADEKSPSYRVVGEDIMLEESAIEPLNSMMDGFFEETGRDTVAIISAYRGYERQQQILSEYIALMGNKEALRYAAPPGYSEHHAGLAVDLGYYSNGVLRTFPGTGANMWFRQNCHNYGFILRFPGEKSAITKTAFEPWHFRYVGLPHSYIIQQNGWCLEEYIEFIMEHTRDEPFSAVFNDDAYEIYFTEDTEILLPYDCEFDISGNNINGFIVTIKLLSPVSQIR